MIAADLLRLQKEEIERAFHARGREIIDLSIELARVNREMVKFRQDFIELMTENESLKKLAGIKIAGEK